MTTSALHFTAWHLESWGYRRTPEDPNRLIHVDHDKPGCLFHPITLMSDLNDGQCVLAVLRSLDAMHRERIAQLEVALKEANEPSRRFGEWKEFTRLEKDLDEVATFCCRLSRALGKDHAISKAAIDYLIVHDLMGSPMRAALSAGQKGAGR